MLESIIDSKHESAVLSFFLVAPERSFSIMELSKRLGIPHAKLAIVLQKLVQHGQIVSFGRGNKKYFMVNTKYKLMPEIKNYLMKSGTVYQDELFAAIRKLGEIKAAFLSGLFTGHPELPVDLLIVGKIIPNKLPDFLKNVAKLMGQEINYSIMTVEEFTVRRDTFDRFIKDIFDYKHIVVVDHVAKKKK